MSLEKRLEEARRKVMEVLRDSEGCPAHRRVVRAAKKAGDRQRDSDAMRPPDSLLEAESSEEPADKKEDT